MLSKIMRLSSAGGGTLLVGVAYKYRPCHFQGLEEVQLWSCWQCIWVTVCILVHLYVWQIFTVTNPLS